MRPSHRQTDNNRAIAQPPVQPRAGENGRIDAAEFWRRLGL
jgi:hypothetical protein